MSARPLVVTYPMSARSRAIVAEELAGAAEVIYLTDLAQEDRADALRQASAVLANDTAKELRPGESSLIGHARLLQFSAAGIDAWWVEPVRHGRFTMGYPFLDLPNVIGFAAQFGGRRGVARSVATSRCRQLPARAPGGNPAQLDWPR
jgi:hypothetical protein